MFSAAAKSGSIPSSSSSSSLASVSVSELAADSSDSVSSSGLKSGSSSSASSAAGAAEASWNAPHLLVITSAVIAAVHLDSCGACRHADVYFVEPDGETYYWYKNDAVVAVHAWRAARGE